MLIERTEDRALSIAFGLTNRAIGKLAGEAAEQISSGYSLLAEAGAAFDPTRKSSSSAPNPSSQNAPSNSLEGIQLYRVDGRIDSANLNKKLSE